MERESTSELYIHQIESKLKTLTDRDEISSEEIAELKKDVARLREADDSNSRFIANLEIRLAKSEGSHASLISTIDRLEKDVARRDEVYRDLESRIHLADTTKDNSLLLRELDEKDVKLHQLEHKLEAALRAMETRSEERHTLLEQVRKGEADRAGLRDRLDELNVGHVALPAAEDTSSPLSRSLASGSIVGSESKRSPIGPDIIPSEPATPTPDQFPITFGHSPREDQPNISPASIDDELAAELRQLQETHTQTLIQLESVSSAYRDSLTEIAELAAQVQEVRLLESAANSSQSRSRTSSAEEDDEGVFTAPTSTAQSLSLSGSHSPTAILLSPTSPNRRKRDSMPAPSSYFHLGGGQPK